MAMQRKTITLAERQDEWVKGQIAKGNFANDSEYLRDLIRWEKEYQENLIALRAALIEGEKSGAAVPYEYQQIIKAAQES